MARGAGQHGTGQRVLTPAASASSVRLLVPTESAGERLDVFLSGVLPNLSRSVLQGLIRTGDVTLNDGRCRAAQRVTPGDVIELSLPLAEAPATPEADAAVPYDVLFADEACIVVDKPPGVVVHPGAGHLGGSLASGLVARFPDLALQFDDQRPGIVHRLDRDTSGVMVVARTPAALAHLKAQFKARTVDKAYLAVIKGAPQQATAVIDAPIGRDRVRRKKLTALVEGRPAQTRYKVLGQADEYCLVEAHPLTGRTHQIRVHFAAIGHPVAGDAVYGAGSRRGAFPRLALHAWRLAFDHPTSGLRLTFVAPIPADLRAMAERVGLKLPSERPSEPVGGA